METKDIVYERRLRIILVLRTIVVATGVLQLLFGEAVIGIAILLSVLAISLPGLFTRNLVTSIPLEFELLLFIMVTLQFVIGESLNFYDNVPYYDKLVHFTLPLFIGFIASMIVYTMYVTGKLSIAVLPAMLIIILLTLGVGAAWEIAEYGSDHILGTHLQGSLTGSPLTDTMNDLIADTLGGIFGALIALRFVRSGRKDRQSRLKPLTEEIAQQLEKPT